MRLDGRADENGGCSPLGPRFGGEEGCAVARSLAQVGACADEFRLMGVERDEVHTDVGRSSGDEAYLAIKSSRVFAPPVIERMWKGPWGDGAN